MLDIVITTTFVCQIYCYWSLGKGKIPYLPQIVVLLGFMWVEITWAAQEPMMYLYVLLNVWGLANMLKGLYYDRYRRIRNRG